MQMEDYPTPWLTFCACSGGKPTGWVADVTSAGNTEQALQPHTLPDEQGYPAPKV
jgi:hypothetical protein